MKRIPLTLTAASTALAVLVAAPGLSRSVALQAQSTATPTPPTSQAPAPTVPAELKSLFEGVKLTEAQIKQVVAIHRKYPASTAAQRDSAKSGMGAGAADRHADEPKELRVILTPDQQKAFDRNLAQVEATRKKPGY